MRDDGVGYDDTSVIPGSGLGNMKDRIDAVGGELTIRSVAGRGVEVAAVVPTARLAEVV